MASTSLNITLTEPLKAYVKAQVEAGDYGTPSDFFRDLIEHDRDRRMARLEDRLLEALKDEPFELPLNEIPEGELVNFLKHHPSTAK